MKIEEKWFNYEGSNKIEEQAKYFVAMTVEGYLNGCYSGEYDPLSVQEWVDYVWNTIAYENGMRTNGHESRHIYFYGKSKLEDLVVEYVTNYSNAIKYTK